MIESAQWKKALTDFDLHVQCIQLNRLTRLKTREKSLAAITGREQVPNLPQSDMKMAKTTVNSLSNTYATWNSEI